MPNFSSVLLSSSVMASAACIIAAVSSVTPPPKPSASPSIASLKSNLPFPSSMSRGGHPHFQSLETKATEGDTGGTKATESNPTKGTKPNSLICADCDGNGARLCTQCEGTGVNSVDHFNGQFKAGGMCWLCRGRREILCGNCNGAGFLGGFMSTFDETSM